MTDERPNVNNPASRVLGILEAARRIQIAAAQNDDGYKEFSVRQMWDAILLDPVRDSREKQKVRERNLELDIRLDEVHRQINQIAAFASENEPAGSRWIEFFPDITALFAEKRFHSKAKDFLADRHVVLVLDYYSSKMQNEKLDTLDSITKLHDKVSDLFAQVTNMDLNRSLKEWVLELLSMIQQGIQRFRISGSREFRRELGKIYATASERFGELKIAAPDTAQSVSQILQDYANIATILSGFVAIAMATQQLLGNAVGGSVP